MYYVYVLECRDGSLYAGMTNDLRRRTKEISFTTKLICLSTVVMVAFGTFTLFVTTPGLSVWESFFQSVAAMTTAGFNTVNIGILSSCSLLILILLMSIGGSPSGTAGIVPIIISLPW